MAGFSYTGNVISSPRWLADFESPDNVLPIPARLDVTQFTTASGVVVAVTATAAQNATSVSVTALALPFTPSTSLISAGNVLIPSGTTLYFSGAKVATLTADAKIGDTTLTVSALPTALASGDTTRYNTTNAIYVPSGTVVGRTTAEQVAGTNYGPAANTDNQIFLQLFDNVDARRNPDIELVRHNATIKVNYLPGYGASGPLGTLSSPTSLLTALLPIYNCIIGKD